MYHSIRVLHLLDIIEALQVFKKGYHFIWFYCFFIKVSSFIVAAIVLIFTNKKTEPSGLVLSFLNEIQDDYQFTSFYFPRGFRQIILHHFLFGLLIYLNALLHFH